MLVCKHPLLRQARAAALLAPDAGDLLLAGAGLAPQSRVQRVGEAPPGEEAVHGLRPGLLTLDDQAARQMPQHDAGGDLVDVLPPLASRAHEALLEVALADPEGSEPRRERALLLRRHGEHRRWAERSGPGRVMHVMSSSAWILGVAKAGRRGISTRAMSMRAVTFLLLCTLALTSRAWAGNPAAGFDETVFRGGFSQPTAIAFLPDGRLLVTEKGGAL